MLPGVLSDEYVKKNCWPTTTPLASNMYLRKPGTFKIQSRIIQAPYQPVSSIADLATNIKSVTLKERLPSNGIAYLTESLSKSYVTENVPQVAVKTDVSYDGQTGGMKREAPDALETLEQVKRQRFPEEMTPMRQPVFSTSRELEASLRSSRSMGTPERSIVGSGRMYTRTGIPGGGTIETADGPLRGMRILRGGMSAVPDYPAEPQPRTE